MFFGFSSLFFQAKQHKFSSYPLDFASWALFPQNPTGYRSLTKNPSSLSEQPWKLKLELVPLVFQQALFTHCRQFVAQGAPVHPQVVSQLLAVVGNLEGTAAG